MKLTKATKTKARLRLALQGASGCGKTFSALSIATNLGARVAFLDTERGSASLYADRFAFDVVEAGDDFNPAKVGEFLRLAAAEGYEVAVIDSLTHFWNGRGGFLELVDAEVKRMQARGGKGDSFAAWKNITPIYNQLVADILNAPIHVIVCLRAKQEYSKEMENGKSVVKKLGMAPEFRDAFQFEMQIEAMLDSDNNLAIGKTRCSEIAGKVFHRPGKDVADILKRWLEDGAQAAVEKPPTIAGSNPDIARPVKAEWTADQLTEAGAIRAEIEKHPGGDEKFRKLWASMKFDHPSTVIDALGLLQRQLEDVASQAAEGATK